MANKRIVAGLAAVVMTLSGVSVSAVYAADIVITETETEQEYSDYGGYIYRNNEDGTVAIVEYTGKDKNVVIPEKLNGKTVTSISGYNRCYPEVNDPEADTPDEWIGAFAHTSISSVVLPDSLTEIMTDAFGYCEDLESVTFGSGIKIIDSCAFLSCPKLKNVKLPDSVEEIGDKAFGYLTYAAGDRLKDFVVYCTPDSAAEKYAKENNFTFLYTSVSKVETTSFSSTSNAVRINWNKVSGASGYRVYRYNSETGKWENIKTITSGSTLTYRDSGLKAGTEYRYGVKAYVKGNGENYWSELGDALVTATKPADVSIKSASRTSSAIRLNWNKAACDGYKIQQQVNGQWKTIKLVSASATTYKLSGLKKNTTYKFRIQAYKRADGVTKYSNWSATRLVTTKK